MPNEPRLIHPGARVGHVHLKVSALQRALDFHCGVLGASDHGVNEALYLRDPAENGVELSWDRPNELWPRKEDGGLAMSTRPLTSIPFSKPNGSVRSLFVEIFFE